MPDRLSKDTATATQTQKCLESNDKQKRILIVKGYASGLKPFLSYLIRKLDPADILLFLFKQLTVCEQCL